MRAVKFITYGSNSLLGNFGAGERMVCSDALARHLVHDARCAKYDDQAPDQASAHKPARGRQGRRRAARTMEAST